MKEKIIMSIVFALAISAVMIVSINSCKKNKDQTNNPPTALFKVTPDSGNINTIFHFDASASTDIEDIDSTLLIRWDFEYDGIWDVDWTTTKTFNHKYGQDGTYSAIIEVVDSEGQSDSATIPNILLNSNGTWFFASPTSGDVPLTVSFSLDLTYGCDFWYWEFGDGDTSFLESPTHTYKNSGQYTVMVTTVSLNGPFAVRTNYINVEGNGGPKPCPGVPTVTYHGQTYPTVLIGDQCWMAKNLNFETGNSWCYNNNASECIANGRLYDWESIMNGAAGSDSVPSGVQGICPDGWHIPSRGEVINFHEFLGGGYVAGGKLKEATTLHWNYPNTGATNSSGYTALPSGYRDHDGNFGSMDSCTYFWTSSTFDGQYPYMWGAFYDQEVVELIYYYRDLGNSLRCIKD